MNDEIRKALEAVQADEEVRKKVVTLLTEVGEKVAQARALLSGEPPKKKRGRKPKDRSAKTSSSDGRPVIGEKRVSTQPSAPEAQLLG